MEKENGEFNRNRNADRQSFVKQDVVISPLGFGFISPGPDKNFENGEHLRKISEGLTRFSRS